MLPIPLLLGAGLLAGAAVSAWRLIQENRKAQQASGPGGSGQGDPNEGEPGNEPGDGDDGERNRYEAERRRDELLRRIVAATEFTVKQMVIDQKVVGSERHSSRIPADDIDIRPIRNLSEIGAALPSTQAMDDDIFFGALAAKSLPVVEHIQTVDVTEDVLGESRNILVILHDVSGSMGGEKIRWAIRLCQLLLDRCIDQGAECILIPYRDYLQGKYVATNEAECQQFKLELSNILQPGGGTRTNNALLEVLNFLKTEKFGQVRILLVTDGEDSIDVSGIRQGFDEIGAYLHTVCIAPVGNEDLRRASDRYDYLSFS